MAAASSTIACQMTAPALMSSSASTSQCSKLMGAASPSLATFPTRYSRRVRCEAGNDRAGGLREAVDQASKRTITKDDILRNQETIESEKKSVLGTEPTSGSLYPRPELERRPETGDKPFPGLFELDGAAPETINGRLAMVGLVWAFVAEKATGLTVFEQLYAGPDGAGVLRGGGAAVHVRVAGAQRERGVHRRPELGAVHSARREVERAPGHARVPVPRGHGDVPPRSRVPLSSSRSDTLPTVLQLRFLVLHDQLRRHDIDGVLIL